MKRIFLLLVSAVAFAALWTGTATAQTVVEGESMTLSPASSGQAFNLSGASGGRALDMWSNGTASKVTGASGNVDSVTIRASRYCSDSTPAVAVKLDGVQVGSVSVTSTSLADYVVPLSPAKASSGTVALAWSNDYNRRCDQNLFVDTVSLHFATPPPPPPPPPPAACADGLDNDGDGLTDYPNDPGCADANDTDETDIAPPPPPPPGPGAALGVYAGQDGGDGGAWESSTMNAVHAFESETASTPKMVHMFYPFYIGGSCAGLPPGPGTAIREGYAPMLTLEFLNYGGGTPPGMTYANINNGTFDACLHSYANSIKNAGGNVYLRMFHEMSGDWYPWAVAGHEQEHIAAWRHIHDLLAADGATNAKMVWCPNNRYPGDAGAYANYYPGDAYVDYLCEDGYNWASAHGEAWSSFDQLHSASYAELAALSPSKPIMVGEYASTEGTSGQKAQWIADAEAAVKAGYPRLKVLNWFNQVDGAALWPVDSSASSLNAYKAYAQDPYFQAPLP